MVSVKGIAVAPRILAPMEGRDHVAVTIEKGLDGDARGGRAAGRFPFFEDDWNDAVASTDGEPMPWMERRANLLVRGCGHPGKSAVFSALAMSGLKSWKKPSHAI